MFFCNLLMILLVAAWAWLGASSASLKALHATNNKSPDNNRSDLHNASDFNNSSDLHNTSDYNKDHVAKLSEARNARGILSKHFPGLFHASGYSATGSVATSNSFNLFGKYLTTAFALSYGKKAPQDLDQDTHVTFVKAVAQSKHPVEVLIISNQGGSDGEFNDDNTLGSYLEDKIDEDRKKTRPTKAPAKETVLVKDTNTPVKQETLEPVKQETQVPVKQEILVPVKHKEVAKNIITLKEKNNNLVKLVSSLAQNYSLEVKEIVPFDDVPSNQKTNLILDIIKVNRQKQDPCYIIVVNGDEQATAAVTEIQGLSVTRAGKGLNIYETEQIEELKRKLNKTEAVPNDGHVTCASFTLYVF